MSSKYQKRDVEYRRKEDKKRMSNINRVRPTISTLNTVTEPIRTMSTEYVPLYNPNNDRNNDPVIPRAESNEEFLGQINNFNNRLSELNEIQETSTARSTNNDFQNWLDNRPNLFDNMPVSTRGQLGIPESITMANHTYHRSDHMPTTFCNVQLHLLNSRVTGLEDKERISFRCIIDRLNKLEEKQFNLLDEELEKFKSEFRDKIAKKLDLMFECYVCLDDMHCSNMVKLDCQHSLCNDCFSHLIKDDKVKCPFCRVDHHLNKET